VERQQGGPTTIRRKEDPLLEEFARLAPKRDVLGVEVIDDGGLLWPEREGPEQIAEVKRVMGKEGFAGQYQQRPAPLGGGMIKPHWFRRYDTKAMPAIDRVILSLGRNFKEGQTEDYSVCEVWAQRGGDFYLLDLWREGSSFPTSSARCWR
jgi:hypothetical protein